MKWILLTLVTLTTVVRAQPTSPSELDANVAIGAWPSASPDGSARVTAQAGVKRRLGSFVRVGADFRAEAPLMYLEKADLHRELDIAVRATTDVLKVPSARFYPIAGAGYSFAKFNGFLTDDRGVDRANIHAHGLVVDLGAGASISLGQRWSLSVELLHQIGFQHATYFDGDQLHVSFTTLMVGVSRSIP